MCVVVVCDFIRVTSEWQKDRITFYPNGGDNSEKSVRSFRIQLLAVSMYQLYFVGFLQRFLCFLCVVIMCDNVGITEKDLITS